MKNAVNTNIKQVKAYSSVYDKRARFPAKNFMDVTKQEVKKEQFDTLLLQSGSVDITNLDTKSQPQEHTEYLKQEVIISARNIFSVAESALESQPDIEKIMKNIENIYKSKNVAESAFFRN